MAWIKVSPSELVQLKKFHDFRVACGWHSFMAQGALYSFWGKVAELKESGEISDWTPDYLAELVALVNIKPERFWDALLKNNDWIEVRDNGQLFVRDWIDIAGPFLKQKYHTSNPEKLVYIWGLYGRAFPPGKRPESDTDPQGSREEAFRNPKGNLKESGPNERNKRTISTSEFRPPPSLLSSPPEEDLKALIKHNPSGSGAKAPVMGNGEISLLIKLFREQQTQKLGEPPAKFNYALAGKKFRELLKNGYTPQGIEERFSPFFQSSIPFVVNRSFCVEDFFTFFNKLKDGPIANQVGPHGQKPYDDGLGSAVYERERQFSN